MSDNSKIEWTDSTWNPIRVQVLDNAMRIAEEKGYTSLLPIIRPGKVGWHCEHAGPGCEECYAEEGNGRCRPVCGTGLPYDRRARDLIKVFLHEPTLSKPLHWRKPRKIFPCSMTDLFGEWVADEMIDKVFAAMALCRQHTFICLTKRGKRMREYFAPGTFRDAKVADWAKRLHTSVVPFALPSETIFDARRVARSEAWEIVKWPLPNVILGVSGSTQADLDKQVRELSRTPAACRLLSLEPQVEDVDISPYIGGPDTDESDLEPTDAHCVRCGCPWEEDGSKHECPPGFGSRLDWVIQGGESGHGARPFDLAWARKTRDQCEAAGVAYFLKQLGAFPCEYREVGTAKGGSHVPLQLRDRKGGDPAEWPADLQDCRAFPELAR